MFQVRESDVIAKILCIIFAAPLQLATSSLHLTPYPIYDLRAASDRLYLPGTALSYTPSPISLVDRLLRLSYRVSLDRTTFQLRLPLRKPYLIAAIFCQFLHAIVGVAPGIERSLSCQAQLKLAPRPCKQHMYNVFRIL